jgi:twitching motility two-component system response regulator PilH
MAKILIVDDLASDRLTIRSVLDRHGDHEIIESTDGEAAFQQCVDQRPDVVFLDIVLPKLDGFQVCRRIKKNPDLASMIVILISSKSHESDRFWGLKQGADDYIFKPIDDAALSKIVDEYLPKS